MRALVEICYYCPLGSEYCILENVAQLNYFFMVPFMSLNVLSVKWATIRVILGKEINRKGKKN